MTGCVRGKLIGEEMNYNALHVCTYDFGLLLNNLHAIKLLFQPLHIPNAKRLDEI